MDSENHRHLNISLVEKDVNLERFRNRYKKLIRTFQFLFLSLALIIATLFIYLVHDVASASDQSTPGLNPVNQTHAPITRSESQIFLQRAAEELDDVASSILYNYLGTNIDIDTEFALNSCWRSLKNGSTRIRGALEANTVPDDIIIKVEESMNSCIGDLEKVESTAAIEVRVKVHRAKVYLSSRGEYLVSFEYIWEKFLRTVAVGWPMVLKMVLKNTFIVCMCVLQLLFILYLLWAFFKSR